MTDIDNFRATQWSTIDGGPLAGDTFAGKAILVVNTACHCGFTPQYAELQTLWRDYQGRGLVVLGVPCNDFGAQEPDPLPEINAFCEKNFGVEFPLTTKQKVKGPDAHPFYLWARKAMGALAAPKWNFHKYLVGPDGRLVDWFSTVTKPGAAKIIKAIEKPLPATT